MVKKGLPWCRQTGHDFYKYLDDTNRTYITDRAELRDIYNEFRYSRNAGTKFPSFGAVLYGLKSDKKVIIQRNVIFFNFTVKAHSRRRRQPERRQSEAASPGSVQNFFSRDEAETEIEESRLVSFLMKELETNRAQLVSDKRGSYITSDQPFEDGKLCLSVEENKYVVNLKVENSGSETLYFTCYIPLVKFEYLSLRDEYRVTRANPLCLEPGSSYEIQVHFCCNVISFYPATLAFEFKPDRHSTTAFYIVRYIEVRRITALGRELAPIAPYKRPSPPAWTPEGGYTIVDGLRPEGMFCMGLQDEFKLEQYPMPQFIKDLIKSLKHPSSSFKSDLFRRELLESPLSWENYSEKFHLLLYLEEHQMKVDIKKYNIPNDERKEAVMTRDTTNKKLLILEVPGVAENRPSVIPGDALIVCPVGEKKFKYRGYIQSVEKDKVKISFGPELLDRFLEGMKFSVEFTVSRYTLRLQHRAVKLAVACGLKNVLFPSASGFSNQGTELPQLRLFDSKLEKNPEQYQAVKHIVAGSSKPAPYLVFGPPGTGKTVTLAEAIKQIERREASCRILACAPCNSAADLLCEKILDHVDERKVFRVYADSYNPKSVPEKLQAFSNLKEEGISFPPIKKLMEYKIVVTTLFTAGRLITNEIPVGHFTHVFVDEAGQAEEPQCVIPLAGLLQAQSGQVVLAGDPKQLGPIIRSPFAKDYKLGLSLLERLMNDIPFQKDNGVYNERFITKLLKNYRSHPDILKISNELFYDEELEVCADEVLRNSYCGWEHLPKEGFPVIFHGVNGKDEREASSPSFFNSAEVEVLMDYVKKLLQTQGKKGLAVISPKHIGIIAPYRKQVQKIRYALKKVGKNLEDLKVGSVEEFQGQERRVIIVSTVRSSPDYLETDKYFNLGFVGNEKRFNVAVTRAKALLIVVGNPRVLNKDSTWARFIQYCRDKGGYTGFIPPEDDINIQMFHLDIKDETEDDGFSESVVQQQLDPEWRNDL